MINNESTKRYKHEESCTDNFTKKYQIRPEFILREVAGEYMIIPTDSNHIFSNSIMVPNGTAVFLWEAFQHPSTIQEVVAKAMSLYDVTEEQIRKSVSNFVNHP